MHQRWNRSGFSRPDPTGKFQNLRRSTGFLPAQSTGFFTEGFCSMYPMKNFQKGRGAMGEILKFATSDGGLRKGRNKVFVFYTKITQSKDPFRFSFGLKDLFWVAQNEHKISLKRTDGKVPSPDQTKWGGTSRKWGGTLKYTELLHIKTDISQLQIMRYFKKLVFMSEKDPVALLARFVWSLENLSAAVNATRSATRTLLRGEGLNQKFFLHKNCLI